jgi:hypothetical protein
MDQSLDARFQFDEGAVAHDVDDFAGVAATDGVFRLDVGPRTRHLVLETQRDLFLLLVHLENVDLELLVDVNDLVRVVETAPRHVGDVQQAVDAAKIDERAELGDILDDTFANLARLDLAQELVLQLGAHVFEQLAARHHDVTPDVVDLENLALDGRADVVADVGQPANIDLRRVQKDVDADVDEPATLDLARHLTRDNIAFLVLLDDHFPFFLPLGLALRKNDGASLILDSVEQHLNVIADVGRLDLVIAFVVPLVDRDDPFTFVADNDDDVVAEKVGDATVNDLIDLEFLRFRGKPIFNVAVGIVAFEGGFKFGL